MNSCDTFALFRLVCSLADEVCGRIRALGGLYGPRKEFLESYCGRVHMPL